MDSGQAADTTAGRMSLNTITTSAFVDQINGSNDASEANDKGSTVNFEQFLRIPYENCEAVVPLRFSVFGAEDEKHIFQVINNKAYFYKSFLYKALEEYLSKRKHR